MILVSFGRHLGGQWHHLGIHFRAWAGVGDRLEVHDFLGGPEIESTTADEGIAAVSGCTSS